MQQEIKKRTGWQRAGRIVLKTILGIFFLILLIFLLILTPPVQNFLRKKAVAFLEKKLETKVQVGRIYIGLPKNIVLENIYIEDRQKDTLLYGGKIKADLNIWRLLTKNEVIIKSIALNNITARIKRQLPDTSFNFQFIVDAFAPADTSATSTADSTSPAIDIDFIELNKIRLVYKDIVTGSDMEAWLEHLDTRIDKFDPEHFHFDVPSTNINGLTARIYQSKPLATPEPAIKDIAEAKQPIPLQLNFKEVDLANIKLDYRNDVSAMYTTLDIGTLNVKPEKIDLANRIIELETFSLDKTNSCNKNRQTGTG